MEIVVHMRTLYYCFCPIFPYKWRARGRGTDPYLSDKFHTLRRWCVANSSIKQVWDHIGCLRHLIVAWLEALVPLPPTYSGGTAALLTLPLHRELDDWVLQQDCS